jgi:hypothetical protein
MHSPRLSSSMLSTPDTVHDLTTQAEIGRESPPWVTEHEHRTLDLNRRPLSGSSGLQQPAIRRQAAELNYGAQVYPP